MTSSNRFTKHLLGLGLMAAALSPVFLEGCSAVTDAQGAVCCTDFAVGGTVGAGIGGSAQSAVAVQAIADIGGTAAAAIGDLTTLCRGIAQDLDASADDQTAAAAGTDENTIMKAWCDLAVKQITSVKAGATLNIEATPPVCSASVSAKLDCQAKCSGGVMCDFKANPPTCMGGTLSVSCNGGCTASGSASVACTGSCTGMCSGSCDATGTAGGADCTGKCEGTCTVDGTASGASGVQADGTCKGKCSGKCTFTDPSFKAMCKGTCSGHCDAKCQGSAMVAVQCDGKCDADYKPLSCTGGTLSGGCMADAKCDGSCNGSVQAKASCTPPSVQVTFSGGASAELPKLAASLEKNLPLLLEIKSRFSAMTDIAGSLSGNISAVVDIKAACIPPLVAATAQAVTDIGATVAASVSITGSLGM